MSEEEFKIYVNDKVASIFSKANDDEKTFINHLINRFNDICDENKQLQNNWNELKEWLIQLQKIKGINQQCFSWGVAQELIDKMQELESRKK